ncbi:GmrSD restriction endonuclease domain-containing protein [Pseudonocardia sp. CA-142604]|uniref:GmrSD restriction endonuclease domain-containing protein n=1 Tax=Pseudonocardia sp. CA-142604 TaxID=3240024 RepID=UPI003D9261B0
MPEVDMSTAPPFIDPRPAPERIVQLASRVLAGDILLPRFQRKFVWKRPQIIDLLDSVRRNYPIGSFLLWQSKQELASERSIGDLKVSDRSPGYPVNYLLDGQQRLSTICGALYWVGDNPTSIWNLAYDLRNDKFFHLNTLDEQAPHIIRTRHLTKGSDFFSRIANLSPELQEKAKAFFDRFTDYQTATVTLGDMPINDIGPVFERINSTGTKLTVVDLMRAATWTPEFDLVERIDSLLESLKPKLFGTVDRKTALRCVAAAAGFGFSSQNMDSLRDLPKPQLASAVDSATEAAKRAADFLATEIGVPSEVALPYTNQFAVLTAIFEKLPHPTPAQYQAIKNWFWRTTFSGYFGGWNTGNMATDYKTSPSLRRARSTLSHRRPSCPRKGSGRFDHSGRTMRPPRCWH